MNLPFHCIFLDGAYTRGADDRLCFRRVVPHTEDIERLVVLGQAALGERASFAGYSLHAIVGFKATDRAGLERLCRYILRPPFAKDRLKRREDGSVVVGLKRVWGDGASALVFSPSELVERLIALVPPPRANQVIYRGMLAGNAAWRAWIHGFCNDRRRRARGASPGFDHRSRLTPEWSVKRGQGHPTPSDSSGSPA